MLFLLAVTAITFGQKIIDTVELYNGILTNKRIEFDGTDKIHKVKYYYSNGKLQTEYFYAKGKEIRWIAYDLNGNQTAEWSDPEVDYAKNRKLRSIVFSITLFCIGGVIIACSRLNYVKTYYSVLCLSIIYPFAIFLTERIILNDEQNEVFPLIVASTLFILLSMLFILSILNFFRKGKIPLMTSIVGILISAGFLLFFIMTMLVSGAGILS